MATKKPASTNKPAKKDVVKTSPAREPITKYPRMGGFWERFLAYFIDSLIVGFIGYVVGFVIAIPFVGMSFMGAASDNQAPFALMQFPLMALSFLSGIAITTLYYGYFYTKNGQSLGKKVLDLKVVKAENMDQPLTWGDSFIREVIGKFISRLLLSLGFLWYFMSPKRQAWHDSIAKTYVVKVDSSGNTYMDGEKEYKKNPLATFSCCGCFGVILLIAIIAAIASAGFIAKNASDIFKEAKNNNNQYQDDYNNNQPEIEDFDDFQRYFEEELEKNMQDEIDTYQNPPL